ncbi:acyl transferase domain-containing protein/NADP-dependent 3-hydroxy acid dehydrogenase YdfG [Haloactinomyces albus]|uniref:Acyl transferase domain-containing protein/NADP-dependent 3-hydroxy acid dehydrogenase YdfG n=1 Tax=Haloactinomyces albus TaxID=1352928 RepID=A0AAE3ZGE6_9ACTN|nr:acyl transferase domain-containing protein/NADP-dependent 3-hydroxy acid dehydrogenase YdfG [Haloactinomyces albus]
MLERLSDARKNGHDVLAVLRSGAINQDGRSQGLTAPNGPSQQRVIRAALAAGDLAPSDIDAVEAHGTGTTLGDPIEANALAATYGRARTDEALFALGSVKSNLGHTQAAAGVAGVIKMVSALQHEQLPRTLHADEPTEHVDWTAGHMLLLSEPMSWPRRSGHVRRAGVSSFGISGTNAHVIVEEAPEDGTGLDTVPSSRSRAGESASLAPVPFVVTGHSDEALRANAARLAAHIDTSQETAVALDVAASLVRTRDAFLHRAVVPVSGNEEAIEALRAVADGTLPSGAVRVTATSTQAIFVFPGQGSQYPGMCRALLDDPTFRAALAGCDDALRPHTGFSVLELLEADDESQREAMTRVTVVQPLLFAVAVALGRLWEHVGIEPAGVIGHSQGEVAAAVVAGALSLEDGARIVHVRSRLVDGLAGDSGMGSVGLPVEEIQRRLRDRGGALSVAVVNTAESTVVAGDREELEAFLAELEAEGVYCRRIAVDYASHSPQVDPILPAIRHELAAVSPRRARFPLYSTVLGRPLDGPELDADYWADNLRRPVRLDLALESVTSGAETAFVELSAHPLLVAPLRSAGHDAVVGSLHRDGDAAARFRRAVAETFAHGLTVDWGAVFDGTGARSVALPTYAFQRQHYWLRLAATGRGDAAAFGLDAGEHPFLGGRTDLPDGSVVFTGSIDVETHSWLTEHRVFDTTLVPGVAIVDMALHAARRVDLDGVVDTVLEAPLALEAGRPRRIQLAVGAPEDGGTRSYVLRSRGKGPTIEAAPDEPWVQHASGVLGPAEQQPDRLESWPPAGAEPVDVEALYERLEGRGLSYGPNFRGLRRLWKRDGVLFADVDLPDEVSAEADAFGMHPVLFDAALHAVAEPARDGGGVSLPFAWRDVRLHAVGATALRARIAPVTGADDGTSEVTLALFDPAGAPVASVGAVSGQPTSATGIRRSLRGQATHLYRMTAPQVLAEGFGGPIAFVDVDPREPDLDRVVEDTDTEAARPTLVARWDSVPNPGEEASADDIREAAHRGLAWLQHWLAAEVLAEARVVWITRRAVARDGDESADPGAATLWGLGRTFREEHPERLLVHLDVDEMPSDEALSALLGRLPDGETEFLLRDGELAMPRLAPVEPREPDVDDGDALVPALHPDGTVLVTGGTGGLARVTSRHLVTRHGARHLLLLSRSGPNSPGASALVEELEALGAEKVTAVSCDVSDRGQLEAALASIDKAHPLTAVVHTATVLDDGLLPDLTQARVDAVLRPKVDAAVHLHELTEGMDLRAFMLFSSMAGTLGGAAQANYAAANAAIDALAALRRHRGLPATSLAWGSWAEVGLVAVMDETFQRRIGAPGSSPSTRRPEWRCWTKRSPGTTHTSLRCGWTVQRCSGPRTRSRARRRRCFADSCDPPHVVPRRWQRSVRGSSSGSGLSPKPSVRRRCSTRCAGSSLRYSGFPNPRPSPSTGPSRSSDSTHSWRSSCETGCRVWSASACLPPCCSTGRCRARSPAISPRSSGRRRLPPHRSPRRSSCSSGHHSPPSTRTARWNGSSISPRGCGRSERGTRRQVVLWMVWPTKTSTTSSTKRSGSSNERAEGRKADVVSDGSARKGAARGRGAAAGQPETRRAQIAGQRAHRRRVDGRALPGWSGHAGGTVAARRGGRRRGRGVSGEPTGVEHRQPLRSGPGRPGALAHQGGRLPRRRRPVRSGVLRDQPEGGGADGPATADPAGDLLGATRAGARAGRVAAGQSHRRLRRRDVRRLLRPARA